MGWGFFLKQRMNTSGKQEDKRDLLYSSSSSMENKLMGKVCYFLKNSYRLKDDLKHVHFWMFVLIAYFLSTVTMKRCTKKISV